MDLMNGARLFHRRRLAGGPLTPEDVLSPAAYRELRPAILAALLRHKAPRRIALGPASLVFESRGTAWFQVQEELRFFPSPSARHVREILDRTNDLVAPPGELRATLLLEAGDEALERRLAASGAEGVELGLRGQRYCAVSLDPGGVDAVTFFRFTPTAGAARADVVHWPALAPPLALSTRTVASLLDTFDDPSAFDARASSRPPVDEARARGQARRALVAQ